MTQSEPGRPRTKAMLKLAGVLLPVLALPVALLIGVGGPVPHWVVLSTPLVQEPDTGFRVPADVLREGVRLVGWAATLVVVLPLALEVLALARARPATTLPPLRWLHQRYAAALFAAYRAWIGNEWPSASILREVLTKSLAIDEHAPAGEDGAVTDRQTIGASDPRSFWHVVQGVGRRRDTLWQLAERYYGDPLAWRAIAEANPALSNDDPALTAGSRILIPAPRFLPQGEEGEHE